MQTLWYLEANYLDACKTRPSAAPSAKRIVEYFHQKLFNRNPFSTPKPIYHNHINPTIIGIGAIFASFGCPQVCKSVREMVFSIGEKARPPSEANPTSSPKTQKPDLINTAIEKVKSMNRSPVSLEDLSTGSAFSFLNNSNMMMQRKASFNSSINEGSPASNYFYSETQFLLTLVEISDRLLSVSKIARQSSLIAELTLFNHNLPADVCLPFWCKSSMSNPTHHRVVRINPSDSVILNSAERVPYMILVEIVENESLEKLVNGSVKSLNRESSFSSRTSSIQNNNSGDLAETDLELLENVSNINNYLTKRPGLPSSSKSSSSQIVEQSETITITTQDSNFSPPEDITMSVQVRMRTAAVMLTQLYQIQNTSKKIKTESEENQLQEIRTRLIQEMMELENIRVSSARGSPMVDLSISIDVDELKRPALDHEDPSAAAFREPWAIKRERIRQASPYGNYERWNLVSVIVKTGADLRQEQLALQLIYEMSRIWELDNVPVWVYNFKILIMSDQAGLIEVIQDAISIHSIKKQGLKLQKDEQSSYSLKDYFMQEFRQPSSYKKAQDSFMRSLAAYSIVCHLLQIKDRHNGNILIDNQGHCIHIDFGFMLSNSPGSVGFELAPFKLSKEYIDILEGIDSPLFNSFVELMIECFLSLRKHADWLVGLVEIMEYGSRLPCFTGITKPTKTSDSKVDPKISQKSVSSAFKDRFQLGLTDVQIGEYVRKLVQSSANNSFTVLYDTFQYYANDVL